MVAGTAAQLTTLREFAGTELPDAVLRRFLVRTGGDVNRAAELLLSEKPSNVGSLKPSHADAPVSTAAPSALPKGAEAVSQKDVKKDAWRRFYKAHLLRVRDELGPDCTRAQVTAKITDNWSGLGNAEREELYSTARNSLIEVAAAAKKDALAKKDTLATEDAIAQVEALNEEEVRRDGQKPSQTRNKSTEASGPAPVRAPTRNSDGLGSNAHASSSVNAEHVAVHSRPESAVINICDERSMSVIDLDAVDERRGLDRSPGLVSAKVSGAKTTGGDGPEEVLFVLEEEGKLDPAVWPKRVATRTVSCQMDVSGRGVVRAGQTINLVSSGKQFTRMVLKGREIGKLNLALGRHLAPALESGFVSAHGRVVYAPKVIPFVNGVIDIEVSVYVEKKVFQTVEEISASRSKPAVSLNIKALGKRGSGDCGRPGRKSSGEVENEGMDLARISVEALLSYLGACEPPLEIEADIAEPVAASGGGVGKFYDAGVEQVAIGEGETYEHPKQMLCSLRDYQKVAVLWMLNCERYGSGNSGGSSASAELSPLWRLRAFADGLTFYSNSTTGGMSLERPCSTASDGSLARGAILADEMGLGKTVETIGMMIRDRVDCDRVLTARDAEDAKESSAAVPSVAPDVLVIGESDAESRRSSAGESDESESDAVVERPVKRWRGSESDTSVVKSVAMEVDGEEKGDRSSLKEDSESNDDGSDSDFVPERRVARRSSSSAGTKLVQQMPLRRAYVPKSRARIHRLRSSEKTGSSKLLQGGTLIVVPMSMVSQWREELNRHVESGFFRVVIHHEQRGGARTLSVKQADVVITTYGVLAVEAPEDGKKGGPLYDVEWRRCVLDEAHTIRGRASKQAAACFQLVADRRWCLTGSPIQNHVNDAQALLRFLRVEPWSAWGYWRRGILSKIESSDEATKAEGYSTLRSVLSPITLRRMKSTLGKDGKPLVNLTERNEKVEFLEFGDAERDFYDTLHEKSKRKFDTYMASGKVTNHWGNVLELLLRLRQAACHPFMVYASSQKDTKAKNDRDSMLKNFNEAGKPCDGDQCFTCPICNGDVEDMASLRECGHGACRECLLGLIEKSNDASQRACPTCNAPIASKLDLVSSSRKDGSRFPMDITKEFQSSAKLDFILSEVRRMEKLRESAPNGCVGKTVVMSSFTSFIDLIGASFDQHGIKFLRFDGTMSSKKREAILKSFSDDDERDVSTAQVLVVSTRSGNQGINLISSSLLLIADPSWNPKVDDQAAARVHRTGQTRNVQIRRLIVRGSVEEKLLAVQQQKAEMTEGALAVASAEDKSVKIDRMKLLFSR